MTVISLFSESWGVIDLAHDYPLNFDFGKKQLLYLLSGEASYDSPPDVTVSRWSLEARPEHILSTACSIGQTPTYFDYQPSTPGGTDHWYLNFADRHLFGFYRSSLFAQDEMQVAEHPVLASIRSKLLIQSEVDSCFQPLTRTDNGSTTPYLIRAAERRIAVDTLPTADNPRGLYGNNFSEASDDVIRKATTVLEPPTLSNIIAIDAPTPDFGIYTEQQVEQVLLTAYTGFSAAVMSAASAGFECTVIHSGNWGCGAFGGNRELMYLAQMIAADLAGADELLLHSVDSLSYEQARNHYQVLCESGADLPGALGFIINQQYQWGVSDGN